MQCPYNSTVFLLYRFHEIFGNYANELFTEKLSKLSNNGEPGQWMFKLGGPGASTKNFAVKSADRKLVGGNVGKFRNLKTKKKLREQKWVDDI